MAELGGALRVTIQGVLACFQALLCQCGIVEVPGTLKVPGTFCVFWFGHHMPLLERERLVLKRDQWIPAGVYPYEGGGGNDSYD
jgi:hypothetical protein